MAYVTPNSKIQIYKNIKLRKDAEDTLLFTSRSAQDTYFGTTQSSNILYSDTKFSYINNGDRMSVRIPATMSTVFNANYMRFQNVSYENKWIYCFVDKVIHINDGCTEIEFTIDPLQTWLPSVDYTLKECHIVRQHQTGSDNIGDNVQPEPITLTEDAYHHTSIYDPYFITSGNTVTPNYYYIVLIDNTGTANLNISPKTNGNVLSRVFVDAIPMLFDASSATAVENLKKLLGGFSSHSGIQPEYIIAVYAISKEFINSSDITANLYSVGVGSTVEFTADGFSTSADATAKIDYWTPTVSLSTIPDGSVDGYTPKNKKLFTYPYCYYDVINPEGKHLKLKYEQLKTQIIGGTNHNPTFKVLGTLTPPCKVVAMPRFYEDTTNSSDNVITLPPIPSGMYNSDAYKNAIQKSVATTLVTIGGTALGGVGGAIASGVAGNFIGGSLSPTYNGDFSDASTAYANGICSLEGRQCYPENFKEIDAYFEAYGYAQNKNKTPDITHRSLWCYIQTKGANFAPVSIPADGLNAICKLFDRGIRFHKNDYTIGNLSSYNNTITS